MLAAVWGDSDSEEEHKDDNKEANLCLTAIHKNLVPHLDHTLEPVHRDVDHCLMAHGDTTDEEEEVCLDSLKDKLPKLSRAKLASIVLNLLDECSELANSCQHLKGELEEVHKLKSLCETKATFLERTCVNADNARVELATELQACKDELSLARNLHVVSTGLKGGSQTGSRNWDDMVEIEE